MKILQIIRRVHPETAFVKCMAVLLAYFFGSYVTGRFHQESGFIGAILACTSAIVVLQERDLKNSLHNAWLRVLGTFIGALIAWIYLLLYSFSVGGLIIAVFILELICMLLNVPDNGKWRRLLNRDFDYFRRVSRSPPLGNGLLRFSEAAVGAGIGIFMVWIEYVFQKFMTIWKEVKIPDKRI